MSGIVVAFPRVQARPDPPSLAEQAEVVEAIADQLCEMLPRLIERGLAPEDGHEFVRRFNAAAETLRRLAAGGGV